MGCCTYFLAVVAVIFAYMVAVEPKRHEFPPALKQKFDDWLHAEWILEEPKSLEWREQLEKDLEEHILGHYVPDYTGVENRTISVPGLFYVYHPKPEVLKAMQKRFDIEDHIFVRQAGLIKAAYTPPNPSGFERGGGCHADSMIIAPRTRINLGITRSCITWCEELGPEDWHGLAPDKCRNCYDRCYPACFRPDTNYHTHGPGKSTIIMEFIENDFIKRMYTLALDGLLRFLHLVTNAFFSARTQENNDQLWVVFPMQVTARNAWRSPLRNLLWGLTGSSSAGL